MTISLIGLDADDTLWHSEDGFHTVTGRFCELLRPYAQDPSNLATTLDMVERRNMVLFGYGVKSFTLSMVEAAIEVSGGTVPAETIQQLVDEGRTLLARPVDLLEGVEEALAAIAARYRLVVITKGDLLHQEQKFHASGLDQHVEEIAVVSEKDVRTYRRLGRPLRRRAGALPHGRQLDPLGHPAGAGARRPRRAHPLRVPVGPRGGRARR